MKAEPLLRLGKLLDEYDRMFESPGGDSQAQCACLQTITRQRESVERLLDNGGLGGEDLLKVFGVGKGAAPGHGFLMVMAIVAYLQIMENRRARPLDTVCRIAGRALDPDALTGPLMARAEVKVAFRNRDLYRNVAENLCLSLDLRRQLGDIVTSATDADETSARRKTAMFSDVMVRNIGKVLSCAAQGNIPITILGTNEEGDVTFSVNMADIGLGRTSMQDLRDILRTHTFVNLIGEVLVRSRLDVFANLLVNLKSIYHSCCKKFTHKNFGVTVAASSGSAVFHFHVSLLYRLLNEELSRLIGLDRAVPAVPGYAREQVEEDEDLSIMSSSGVDSYTVGFSRNAYSPKALESAIELILDKYGIKDKTVHVALTPRQYTIIVNQNGKPGATEKP